MGWPVYGLQTGLDKLGHDLTFDGDFGPATDLAVRNFQIKQKLTVDGIAGITTQARIVTLIDAKTHDNHPRLPTGLLRGFAESEGGNNLGAVNWSVKGGVDCGVVQIRCYGPPYKSEEMYAAYHPGVAMERVAVTFLARTLSYSEMKYAKKHPIAFSQRCAALSWNWPFAAQEYAVNGALPNPNRIADWAVGIKFPDGTPVRTWKDWAQFYAMGGPHGEGRVTRYVRW
jgi:hypothetical protein